MSAPKDTPVTIIPGLRYQDAPKAIDWLCRAFGFEKKLVVPGEGGSITHARAAGAEIVMDIEDADYGGRGYSCRDLEGHVWSFGTHDPWAS